MHQIQFRLGLRTRRRWGLLERSPALLAEFKGPTSKDREGTVQQGRTGEGKGGKRRQGKGEGRHPWFLLTRR